MRDNDRGRGSPMGSRGPRARRGGPRSSRRPRHADNPTESIVIGDDSLNPNDLSTVAAQILSRSRQTIKEHVARHKARIEQNPDIAPLLAVVEIAHGKEVRCCIFNCGEEWFPLPSTTITLTPPPADTDASGDRSGAQMMVICLAGDLVRLPGIRKSVKASEVQLDLSEVPQISASKLTDCTTLLAVEFCVNGKSYRGFCEVSCRQD